MSLDIQKTLVGGISVVIGTLTTIAIANGTMTRVSRNNSGRTIVALVFVAVAVRTVESHHD